MEINLTARNDLCQHLPLYCTSAQASPSTTVIPGFQIQIFNLSSSSKTDLVYHPDFFLISRFRACPRSCFSAISSRIFFDLFLYWLHCRLSQISRRLYSRDDNLFFEPGILFEIISNQTYPAPQLVDIHIDRASQHSASKNFLSPTPPSADFLVSLTILPKVFERIYEKTFVQTRVTTAFPLKSFRNFRRDSRLFFWDRYCDCNSPMNISYAQIDLVIPTSIHFATLYIHSNPLWNIRQHFAGKIKNGLYKPLESISPTSYPLYALVQI